MRITAPIVGRFRAHKSPRPVIGFRRDGKPVFQIAGGAPAAPAGTTTTVQDLRDERGRTLSSIDDILRTAREDENRALTAEEWTQHDELVVLHDTLSTQIAEAEATTRTGDANQRQVDRASLATIRMNGLAPEPPTARRSLDELLWATAPDVAAGEISRSGVWQPNPYGARNAVEALRARDLDGDAVIAPRIDEFVESDQAKIRRFQSTVTDMILVGLMVDKEARTARSAFEAAKGVKAMRKRYDDVMRAMDAETTAEGIEFIPTGLGSELHEKVRAAGKVAPLFAKINLPTNPWEMPVEGADATAYRVAEPTSDTAAKVTASTPGTKKVAFDAEIMGGRVLFSRSLDADSAIAILPYVRNKVVRAFVDAEEKAILDGDTDGAHQDSDTQAAGATHFSSAWDGLRKKALAQTSLTAANAAVTLALFRATRKKMLKWGLNPSDLAIICGVRTYFELLDLAEVKTLDVFGPQATILNGQLGALDGIPLIVSEYAREDLNATGAYDGVTTDRGGLLIVQRSEWAIGQRMAMDVEVDDSIYRESFQRVVVAFMREDFQNVGSDAANEDTAILFNIA